MIEVKIEKDNNAFSLSAKGHAGYDMPGKDIVCAGVTSAFYYLYFICTHFQDSGRVKDLNASFKSGDIRLSFNAINMDEVSVAINGFADLIKNMQKNYKNYIRFQNGAH